MVDVLYSCFVRLIGLVALRDIMFECVFFCFFFFKQMTAFELRISDWSSAVCSSDLLVADLESPVSAFLYLADSRPWSCLLESVEGGAVRGRYSIIVLKPDLLWRCHGSKAEINRNARFDQDSFEPCHEPTLESLRKLLDENHKIGRAHV